MSYKQKMKKEKWGTDLLLAGQFVHEVCCGHQRHRIPPRAALGCRMDGDLHWGPHELGSSGSASALFSCAPGALIDHSPPFSAFSSRLHFPKSIFEGNFGCGYLKERRASGLVFCENTTSVYRALFVSPPGSFLCWVVSAGAAWIFCAVCLCGMTGHAVFIFLHDFSSCVFSLCWFCKM